MHKRLWVCLALYTHYPKYLNQFLTVLLETFTTRLVFVRRSKQGAATLCSNQNYTLP